MAGKARRAHNTFRGNVIGNTPFQVNRFCLHFVGGIFGAGKSTLCQTLAHLLPAEHLKASDLIGYTPDPRDATGKATGEVLSNQDRLIAALDVRRRAGGIVLLDGHFCLLDNTYSVVPLPVRVFERINPSAMVLVEATDTEVVDRRAQRDGKQMDAGLVQRLLQSEREHSHAIAQALGVPLMLVNSSTPVDTIVDHLRSASHSR